MKYVYKFAPWPLETGKFTRSVFDLFNALTGFVEMEFTEAEFTRFRLELIDQGFSLREITRRPIVQLEAVP